MVALPVGTQLENLVIESVLGQGGFGLTYLADDATLKKKFAIKEYFPEFWASRDTSNSVSVSANNSAVDDYAWGLERFIEEAQTLARFRHPSIVQVNRIIPANGTAYMVLDFEAGDDFGEWLKKLGRPPSQEELDSILGSLLDALNIVHENNILHRDIAPDNIKIRPDGSPVLLDFGSAREAIGKRTQTISAIIKHGYSPSEQYSRVGKDQGPWSDIYALGATLYKAVTGKAPPDSIDRIAEDDYVPAKQLAAGDYRDGFLAAIDHALRRQRKNRPQSLEEWREELFAEEPIRADSGPELLKGIGEKLLSAAQVAEQQTRAALSGSREKLASVARSADEEARATLTDSENKISADTPTSERQTRVAPPQQRFLPAIEPAAEPGKDPFKLVAAIVAISILIMGGYYFWIYKPSQREDLRVEREVIQRLQADENAWRRAERGGTLSDYRQYLALRPNGKYSAVARSRVAELERAQPRRQ